MAVDILKDCGYRESRLSAVHVTAIMRMPELSYAERGQVLT